ncbi:hypothetical protein ACSVDE_13805 [Pseudalkalibacillus sp. Hm43]|uniref:hypothetical protein n=1 Tax=Pseudalkalibacillus sp. Hm43 TaxID=3450742 RepID=UPI003F41EB75
MKSMKDWVLPVLFVGLSILTVLKGLELHSYGTNVDGQGIGVYFLFFEINDRVPENDIPAYAYGFFLSSLAALLVAIGLFFNRYLKLKHE